MLPYFIPPCPSWLGSSLLILLSFPDLQAQISSAERKNKRLKEVFAQKIQEFREACYSLTGYRIDAVQDQKYKLISMYAERSSDCLLFQVSMFRKQSFLAQRM